MKRDRLARRYNFIVLFAALVLALVFAGTSLSRFVFEENDTISGSYTNFILTHNGEGQTAILQSRMQAGSGSTNVAYILVDFSNFEVDASGEHSVAQRKIQYSLRTPTADEMQNGITDAWGEKVMEASELQATQSENYTVSLANDAGEPIDDNSLEYAELTTLAEKEEDTNSVLLRIERTEGAPLPSGARETLTVVLETQRPYIDRRVFNISVTASLISLGSLVSDEYFGFNAYRVSVRTAADFTDEKQYNKADYGAELTFTASQGLIFDAARFADAYPNIIVTPVSGENGYSYTFFALPGSEIDLYFYTAADSYSLTVSAKVNGSNENYQHISGVGEDTGNSVFTVLEGSA
mgnify:CR=1 FL=1